MDDSPTFSFSGGSPENNQLPPRKRRRSFDNNDNIIVVSTPPKRQQFAVPKDVTEGSASRTITAWRKLHEMIKLLNKILEYYNQNGTYPFDETTHMQRFYKSWIETEAYVDEDVFNNKMVELPERFFKNQEKSFVLGGNLKAWMPPADVRVYELCNMIWGGGDDDDDVDDADDDGSILDDPEVGDQEGNKGGES